MSTVITWVQGHWGLILGTIGVIANEVVAWSPNLKSNSIIQFLLGLTPPQNQTPQA